jgi:hypothetical protein
MRFTRQICFGALGGAWRDPCTTTSLMQPAVRVKFERMARDPSVEASVHRWIARLESANVPLCSADITIEKTDGERTAVHLKLDPAGGPSSTIITSHDEIYVAVADAFRSARRQLLARPEACDRCQPGMKHDEHARPHKDQPQQRPEGLREAPRRVRHETIACRVKESPLMRLLAAARAMLAIL